MKVSRCQSASFLVSRGTVVSQLLLRHWRHSHQGWCGEAPSWPTHGCWNAWPRLRHGQQEPKKHFECERWSWFIMIYHDLIHDISWFIAIHVLVTCSHVDSAANQRLVGLWIKLYCNCYPCDTSIIFSGSQLLASIALKSVISCAGNVFYSVLSQLFHVVSMFSSYIIYMGLGTTCVSTIWRSLSLMRLHSFTISQIVSSMLQRISRDMFCDVLCADSSHGEIAGRWVDVTWFQGANKTKKHQKKVVSRCFKCICQQWMSLRS